MTLAEKNLEFFRNEVKNLGSLHFCCGAKQNVFTPAMTTLLTTISNQAVWNPIALSNVRFTESRTVDVIHFRSSHHAFHLHLNIYCKRLLNIFILPYFHIHIQINCFQSPSQTYDQFFTGKHIFTKTIIRLISAVYWHRQSIVNMFIFTVIKVWVYRYDLENHCIVQCLPIFYFQKQRDHFITCLINYALNSYESLCVLNHFKKAYLISGRIF